MQTLQFVYKIVNIQSGKFYVGRTRNLTERYTTHRRLLQSGKHHCTHLQRAWSKYGEQLFRLDVISVFDTGNVEKDLVLAKNLEQLILDSLFATSILYNASSSSETSVLKGSDHPFYKMHPIQWIGKDAYKKAMDTLKKKVGSKNHFYRKHHTEAVIQLLRKKCAMYGIDNPFFGKEHSQETRKRVAQGRRGKATGTSPTNSKKVVIDDIVYESCTKAAIAIGVSGVTISKRCKNEKYPNYMFLNCHEEVVDVSLKPQFVKIEEVFYESIATAANALGLSREAIKKRCKSDGFPGYCFVEDDQISASNAKKIVKRKQKFLRHSTKTKKKLSLMRGSKVVVDECVYNSILEASTALGVSTTTIRNRCENYKFPNYRFLDQNLTN